MARPPHVGGVHHASAAASASPTQAFLDSLPARLRGQAFGLNSTGAMGGQGLLPPAAGGLASAFGAGAAMAIAGAATILAALLLRGPLTGRASSR